MKDHNNFTKDFWQLVFKTHECLDLCKPLGSSSWEYYLTKENDRYSLDDDQMLIRFGHTKRCAICDIPMDQYSNIKETLGEEVVASWKREAELQEQEIMILCVFCLELMTIKEQGHTIGTTVKTSGDGRIVDVIKEHPSTHPEYFKALKERPLCVH